MDWLVYSLQSFSSANFSRAMFFHPNMHAKQNTSVKNTSHQNTIYTPYARRKQERWRRLLEICCFRRYFWRRAGHVECVLLKTQQWICGDIRTDYQCCIKQEWTFILEEWKPGSCVAESTDQTCN